MNKPVQKLSALMLLAFLLLSAGCSAGYYAQAINGHLKLMRARTPVAELIASADTPSELKQQLELSVRAREFASDALLLPQNDSYSTYVETGRAHVTWNVVAAPEFSLTPQTWCFPIAGCVSYRGYFKEASAEAFRAELSAQGFDTIIGGASAYSTLGWFSDPILDTMLKGGDLRLVGTLFHELAHQKLYIKDDSSFNEAFASFVEQEGVRRWLQHTGQLELLPRYEAWLERQVDFNALLAVGRKRLVTLYREAWSDEVMRVKKAESFDLLRQDYETLKTAWGGYSGYDGWFQKELNNARLISVATYRKFIPGFQVLFDSVDQDFESFYQKVATEEGRALVKSSVEQ